MESLQGSYKDQLTSGKEGSICFVFTNILELPAWIVSAADRQDLNAKALEARLVEVSTIGVSFNSYVKGGKGVFLNLIEELIPHMQHILTVGNEILSTLKDIPVENSDETEVNADSIINPKDYLVSQLDALDIIPGTLVLVDLDKTTFASLRAADDTKVYRLFEAGLPAAIQRLQDRGAIVVGYTARDIQNSSDTDHWLATLGIKFNTQSQKSPDDKQLVNGVYYTNRNCKGKTLSSALAYFGTVSHLVVVDDTDLEIAAVVNAANQLSIPVKSIHYTLAETIAKTDWAKEFTAMPLSDVDKRFMQHNEMKEPEFRDCQKDLVTQGLIPTFERMVVYFGLEIPDDNTGTE